MNAFVRDQNLLLLALLVAACRGGRQANGNPAPPIGTGGEIDTQQPAVGAHQQHLAKSAWHRDVQCADCHVVPLVAKHKNGVIDFAWSSVATAVASTPTFDAGTATCSGAYCHGGTLFDAATVKTKPVWTQVDGTFNSCGAACHRTPSSAEPAWARAIPTATTARPR